MTLHLIIAACVSLVTLMLIRRGMDVRFVLIIAGMVMMSFVGTPWVVLDVFQKVLGRGDVIGPICSAMGFAFVLKATECDSHMVRMLMHPLRSARWLLVPGGCLIGFVTNMAITSQTASAAAVGPILIPLMIAAGYRPLAAAATVLVGCSIGGNLFNPGEPDIVAIRAATGADISTIINVSAIPNLVSFAVGTFVLMLMVRRLGLWNESERDVQGAPAINSFAWHRALIPPLPVLILLLLQPGLDLAPSITRVYPMGVSVSAVMLVCSGLVMLVTMTTSSPIMHVGKLTKAFFEGMGYAFAKVISIIIAAACFLAGLEALGAISGITQLFAGNSALASMLSPVITWGLAVLSGSGTAPSVAFSQAVLPGMVETAGIAVAVTLGVAGAIGASIGRTMSPVAAVMIFTSTLAEVEPAKLVRLVMVPMAFSLLSAIVYGLFV